MEEDPDRTPLTIPIWTFLFLGALALLTTRRGALSVGLLAAGYVLAFGGGLLDWRTLLPLLLLLAAAYAVAPQRGWKQRIAGHALNRPGFAGDSNP